MRLWHQDLIEKLPRQQLLGQHRECCALRGNGWGKKHSTVDYVFKYSPVMLYSYHLLVMHEMSNRGYEVKNKDWFIATYRGLNCDRWQTDNELWKNDIDKEEEIIYLEHNNQYLKECLDNLKSKGIMVNI